MKRASFILAVAVVLLAGLANYSNGQAEHSSEEIGLIPTVISFLSIGALGALIASLIKPTIFKFLPNSWQTRSRTSLLFGLSAFVCFVLIVEGVGAPQRGIDNVSTNTNEISPPKPYEHLMKEERLEKSLIKAAKEGNTETIRNLLEDGVDIEARYVHGQTPLMLVANYGHSEAIQLLLEAGANTEAQDDSGKTALIYATRDGHTEAIQILLKSGADKDAHAENGWTALHYAAWYEHSGAMQILENAGADKEAKTRKGNTAYDLLKQKQGNKETNKQTKKPKKDNCRWDSKCWGDRHWAEAEVYCASEVEKLGRYAHKWTDGWTGKKFPVAIYDSEENKKKGILFYAGDRIEFQNGFGAYQPHTYGCFYDTINKHVVEVVAQPGRF